MDLGNWDVMNWWSDDFEMGTRCVLSTIYECTWRYNGMRPRDLIHGGYDNPYLMPAGGFGLGSVSWQLYGVMP